MSSRARAIWVGIAVVAVGAAAALYWFQPWRLFTNTTVNETLPSIETTHDAPPTPAQEPVRENVLLASGTIISHEHESNGTAKLFRLADGRVQLGFENLVTSDGPDLHVWLTDQPVIEGKPGWFVFDDGRYVELGPLKGNRGNQVYDVPPGTDLNGLTSVSIWCKRFSVSFGAAALNPE
jgi:Electron transfer DM13